MPKSDLEIKPSKTYAAPFLISDNYIQIRLPSAVTKYLKLKRGQDLFFSCINQTVQLTAHEPKAGIPVLDEQALAAFLPAKSNRKADEDDAPPVE